MSKLNKKEIRLRRAKRTRMHIGEQFVSRISVHKTPQHIYAQILSADGASTLVSASTLDKALRSALKTTGNVSAAEQVGKLLAERAVKAGVKKVAFDRSGFKFHGRIKALADAAREHGLEF